MLPFTPTDDLTVYIEYRDGRLPVLRITGIEWPRQRPTSPFLPVEEKTAEEIEQLKASLYAETYTNYAEKALNKLADDYLRSRLSDDEALHQYEQGQARVPRMADETAKQAAQRATRMSWAKTRKQIWERDRAVCQVCGVNLHQSIYECGHIIDRTVGGSDRLANLVAMCVVCNQLKPFTETIDLYLEWARTGGPVWSTIELFQHDPDKQPALFPLAFYQALRLYMSSDENDA